MPISDIFVESLDINNKVEVNENLLKEYSVTPTTSFYDMNQKI